MDIVAELREPRAPMVYQDSVRVVTVSMPDSLHLRAAAEIERLRARVADLEAEAKQDAELLKIANDPDY